MSVVNDVPPPPYLTSLHFIIPVLSTEKFVFPVRFPIKVGLLLFILRARADWVAVLTGRSDGDVLATLDSFDSAVVNDKVDGPYNKSLVVILP